MLLRCTLCAKIADPLTAPGVHANARTLAALINGEVIIFLHGAYSLISRASVAGIFTGGFLRGVQAVKPQRDLTDWQRDRGGEKAERIEPGLFCWFRVGNKRAVGKLGDFIAAAFYFGDLHWPFFFHLVDPHDGMHRNIGAFYTRKFIFELFFSGIN